MGIAMSLLCYQLQYLPNGNIQQLLVKGLDLLYWAICAVLYRRIAMAIKTASKVGVFVDCYVFVYCPGSCRGNTEQVVA
jgi:hypothetical protein